MGNIPLKSISFPGLTNKYLITGDVSQAEFDALEDDVTQLKADLTQVGTDLDTLKDCDVSNITGWLNGYIATNGQTVDASRVVANLSFNHTVINVSEGERYYIHIKQDAGVARGYCVIDSQSNVLIVSSGSGRLIDTTITIPVYGAKLIINIQPANNDYAYKVVKLLSELQEHSDSITQLQEDVIQLQEDIPEEIQELHDEDDRIDNIINKIEHDIIPLNTGDYEYIDYINGYYINISGASVDVDTPVANANWRYCVVDASEGDRFFIRARAGSKAVAYAFINATSVILEKASASEGLLSYKILAPVGTSKLVLNDSYPSGEQHYAYKINPVIERINQVESDIDVLQRNPIFSLEETYNLVKYEDMLYHKRYSSLDGGRYTDVSANTTISTLISVEPGSFLKSNKHLECIYYFDIDKTFVSSESSLDTDSIDRVFSVPNNCYYVKPMWFNGSNPSVNIEEGELADLYYVQQYGGSSDIMPIKPNKQINGRYVSVDFYEASAPVEKSNFDIVARCHEIKRNNRERGAIRIGTFNIYGAMIKFINWPAVKEICTFYGLDACGFQEVPNLAKWAGTSIPKYSFSKFMIGDAFNYSNLGQTDPDDRPLRIMSGLEMLSGEYVPYTYEYSGTTYTAGYAHAIMKLPNYHHARQWDKKVSMYACHFPVAAALARAELTHMSSVIESDENEYIVLVADTNCFSCSENTGKPWCWSYLEEMGLHPSAEDFTRSTYCYPLSTEQWSTDNLDFIDNVFISSNMKCVGWGVVDSQEYPVANASGGYVSDHCMLYADVIFDYVNDFNDV